MPPDTDREPDEVVYLVGGAVRDELLGVAHKERDWVVVGSTPEALLEKGYKQVGASFPVFLHPGTGEEYALARTERKQGHGYHGFAVDFHPGKADLESRVLRHVSPAFCEDPLRVLRVARFAARFAPLGFTVHPSTEKLMHEITESGELSHLVPERVWGEIESALSTGQPGVFIEVLRQCGALLVLLPEVDVLFGVPQPEKHHPEIDTGVHVIMAMNLAARAGWSAEVVFALLLHDLGKGLTDPGNWPSHIGHERAGVPLVERVCERFRVPGAYRDLALKVCALHLRCHRLMEMKPSRVMALLEEADLLRRPEQLEPFTRACEADYRGREGSEDDAYPQARKLAAVLEASLSIKARQLDTSGLDGRAIGELLRRTRIEAISRISHQ